MQQTMQNWFLVLRPKEQVNMDRMEFLLSGKYMQ